MTATYGPDTFTQANGTLNTTNWALAFGSGGNWLVNSNTPVPNTGSGRTAVMVNPSLVEFSPDHLARATYVAIITNDFAGPAVRVSSAGCYALLLDGVNNESRRIVKFTPTGQTLLGVNTPLVPSLNDVWELQVTTINSGTTARIRAFRNGIMVREVTDSSSPILTGQPGMAYFAQNNRATRLDNFYAEDLGANSIGFRLYYTS